MANQRRSSYFRITVAVNQSLDLSQIFCTFGEQLEKEFLIEGGVILLFDELSDSLLFQYQWGMPERIEGILDRQLVRNFFHKDAIRKKTAVSLSVSDNGIGLRKPLDQILNSSESGIGLAGMQERLQLLGGKLILTSQSGKQTTVKAIVPSQKIYPKE